jgi:hypothetical protein
MPLQGTTTASPKRYGGGKAVLVHTHFNSLLHLPAEKKFNLSMFDEAPTMGGVLTIL